MPNNKLPDPKDIVSAAVGGAIELAEGPVRALGNAATAVDSFAGHVKANMDTLKKAPEDPGVIVSVALNGISHTIADGLAFFKGIGKAAMDTAEGVETNLKKITG